MNILGIGAVSCRGVGVSVLEAALAGGWREPSRVESPREEGNARPAYLADLTAAPDRALLKKLRRADKLSKMCVLAAAGALEDGGISHLAEKRVGIILATAFGAQVTTFEFLDGILDFGDAQASPTAFSNSVHNAAASYVSSSLGIRGPTLTVTRFRFSFPSALQLARVWLEQGRCDYLLVGGADQYGDVLGYVAARMLHTAADGRIRPFVFNPALQVPGEGALFLLLSREQGENTYCAIESLRIGGDPRGDGAADVNIVEADGMLRDESGYLPLLDAAVPTTAFAPLFGSMQVGCAFNLAAGALMLRRQVCFAPPVADNPHGLTLVAGTGAASLAAIRCIGLECGGETSSVRLTRRA